MHFFILSNASNFKIVFNINLDFTISNMKKKNINVGIDVDIIIFLRAKGQPGAPCMSQAKPHRRLTAEWRHVLCSRIHV